MDVSRLFTGGFDGAGSFLGVFFTLLILRELFGALHEAVDQSHTRLLAGGGFRHFSAALYAVTLFFACTFLTRAFLYLETFTFGFADFLAFRHFFLQFRNSLHDALPLSPLSYPP